MNASNSLFALAFHRVLARVQSLPVDRQGPYWPGVRVCGRLLRARGGLLQLAVSLLGCKETFFSQGQIAEGEATCYSRSCLFLYWGHLVPCPHLIAPLPCLWLHALPAGSKSRAHQGLSETDSNHCPGRKLTWQKSGLFAPGLMNWISSVKTLMNISLMQEKWCISMTGMERRKGRARARDVLLLAMMNCESDSTLTCNFPRRVLIRDCETGTAIVCHYHKQSVVWVLKQEITVHSQDSQIHSEGQ